MRNLISWISLFVLCLGALYLIHTVSFMLYGYLQTMLYTPDIQEVSASRAHLSNTVSLGGMKQVSWWERSFPVFAVITSLILSFYLTKQLNKKKHQ
ncbi:hypothetical protein [Caldalkalibacillus mannanilyticus]|uniref:hypothetical protein n=1 Tax=Caldalkalibacillus mannanilyticus TaxID=1418 RepID=UPI00046AB216|nr:hypothetical protein [Caldalkalibacillus mannanilyticus]